jgi:hypothetical protein
MKLVLLLRFREQLAVTSPSQSTAAWDVGRTSRSEALYEWFHL